MVTNSYQSIKGSELGLNLSSTWVKDFEQQVERFPGISVSTINSFFSRAVDLSRVILSLTQGMLDSV